MITATENAKYKMLLSTSQRLSQSASLVSTLPTYSTIYAQFLSDFSQLQSVCEQLQVNKQGVKHSKVLLQNDMAEKAYDILLKLKAFARVTANDVLLKECSITKSQLLYVKNVDARNNAMVIYTKASANATALVAYGVTAAAITALKTAIDAFTVAIPSTTYIRTDKKDLMLKRQKYINACINSLLKVDALVEIIRTSQPTFYLQYKDARRVIQSATTLSLKGLVKDAVTGENISGVNIDLLPEAPQVASLRAASTESVSATSALLSKRTVGKGGFNVKNLPAGVYTISVSKYGYATQLQTITVNPGETTRLHVQLEKSA